MLRYKCDRCEKEIDEPMNMYKVTLDNGESKHLCDDCDDELRTFLEGEEE